MKKDEVSNEQVGNIRIKEIKEKKPKKKPKNTDGTSFGIKFFVWFMFIAMAASFIAPLIYYFITAMANK